jgi:hypothetical protein
MLVTNQYGRSLVSSNLYRVSAAEKLYNFQSYAGLFIVFFLFFKYSSNVLVISSISPNTGSTQGGTTLTINGQYFSSNTEYPLVVNVGGQACIVTNISLTAVQCQTSAAPTSSQSYYQGACGLQLFQASGAIAQV